MSKLINEAIITYQSKPDTVTAFIWRKRLYRVTDVIDWWREPGNWWDNKPTRFYFRINAVNKSDGIYEICKIGDEWFLHRVID